MYTLLKYGFEKVGIWKKSSRVKSGITFEAIDSILLKSRVIYAFVCENEIKYIGICDISSTSLEDRLKRYKYMTGGGTNKCVAEKIRKCLEEGKQVEIFALKPKEKYKFIDVVVDLVRGLEYPLIREFKTNINGWNKQF